MSRNGRVPYLARLPAGLKTHQLPIPIGEGADIAAFTRNLLTRTQLNLSYLSAKQERTDMVTILYCRDYSRRCSNTEYRII